MLHARVWVLLVFILHPCSAQQSGQLHITIRPRVLYLSEGARPRVDITCKQLVSPAGQPRVELTLVRKPVRAMSGHTGEEKVADMQTSGAVTVYSSEKSYVASGSQTSRTLVLSIVPATCRDAMFSFICQSPGNQEVSDRIAVAVAPPTIKLTAAPSRKQYAQEDTLTLTCSNHGAIGLTNSPATLGQWVWEYNDMGPWLPAPKRDIVKANLTERGCFQNSTPTSLRVRVKDLKTCSRRFRCYVKTGVVRAVDDAQERDVSLGFECDDTSHVFGTNPVVAIIFVLALLVVFVSAAFLVVRYSRMKRAMKKKVDQKAMEMRLLSPMTPDQRDRMLSEQMQEMKKQSGETTPTKPESLTSSSVDAKAVTPKGPGKIQSILKKEKLRFPECEDSGSKKEEDDNKEPKEGSKESKEGSKESKDGNKKEGSDEKKNEEKDEKKKEKKEDDKTAEKNGSEEDEKAEKSEKAKDTSTVEAPNNSGAEKAPLKTTIIIKPTAEDDSTSVASWLAVTCDASRDLWRIFRQLMT